MDLDDELADYSGDEGFHEDDLNDEDYELLYTLLPQAKEEIAKYNPDIDDATIKEALYANYFELEDSLEDLRSRFPKKKGTFHYSETFVRMHLPISTKF